MQWSSVNLSSSFSHLLCTCSHLILSREGGGRDRDSLQHLLPATTCVSCLLSLSLDSPSLSLSHSVFVHAFFLNSLLGSICPKTLSHSSFSYIVFPFLKLYFLSFSLLFASTFSHGFFCFCCMLLQAVTGSFWHFHF